MKAGGIVLGVAFLSIGVAHTVFVRALAAIVPDYLPAHRDLVLVSGWTASAAGAALLVPETRRAAAWFMLAWLVAVYAANIWMVQHPDRYHQVPEWMLWARLPFQLPMLWWVYQYTKAEGGPRLHG